MNITRQKIRSPLLAIAKHVGDIVLMMINNIKRRIKAFLRFLPMQENIILPLLLFYEKYDILFLVTQKSQIRRALYAYVLACESQARHEQKDAK